MGRLGLAKISFAVFLLCSAFHLSGQDKYIAGKVLDSENMEPLAFVNIRIKDQALGVISNVDGSFKVPSKYKRLGSILEIWSLGYEKIELSIDSLRAYGTNIVLLDPKVEKLPEVTVTADLVKKRSSRKRRYSARGIVRRAIRAIPENYPVHTHSVIGYYRDYQNKKNGGYLNLNEAILEVIDRGFDEPDITSTQVRMYDYYANYDFPEDTLALSNYDYKTRAKIISNAYIRPYGGNEFTILGIHNAIRNHKVNTFDFINRFSTDFLSTHYFAKLESTFDGDLPLWQIHIGKRVMDYRVEGKLFISKDNFAIHRMDYAVYDIERPPRTKGKRNYEDRKLLFEVKVAYKPWYNKMFLDYISFHNAFQVNKPPKFVVKEVVLMHKLNCFEVRFSKLVDPKTGGNPRNYDFRFFGKKLRFKNIAGRDNVVRLYLDLDRRRTEKAFKLFKTWIDDKNRDPNDFTTNFKKIKGLNETGDIAHVLNKVDTEAYFQYREFFTQRVRAKATLPKDTLYMKRNRPLFKYQPLAISEDSGDYWMNTPLRTIQK